MASARDLEAKYQTYRLEFAVPSFGSLGIESHKYAPHTPAVYFCGNSLGLMPKATRAAISNELSAWEERGVESHFNHPTRTLWVDIDLPLIDLLAPIVGALPTEVAAMGSLTANLNALLVSFYKPEGSRTKILFEKGAFPSDYYALLNIVKLHGFDESHLIQIEVPEGETYLPKQLVLDTIDKHQNEIALVCLPGIQYYTGQLFDIKTITAFAKARGCVVGWDLAHAVGNAPLSLHEWDVDFAAWCSYKYLNSGPGAIGGIFVNEKYTKDNSPANFTPRLAGWWGNNSEDRFKMLEVFDPLKSALSYRQSNPSVIDCVALQSSLEIFKRAGGVKVLRQKSEDLTNFMEELLEASPFYLPNSAQSSSFGFKILTPREPEQRGAQLSLLFQPHNHDSHANVMESVHKYLHNHAIICDERRPDVIRLAPVPLYNTFAEVEIVISRINEAMAELVK